MCAFLFPFSLNEFFYHHYAPPFETEVIPENFFKIAQVTLHPLTKAQLTTMLQYQLFLWEFVIIF